MGRYTVIPQNTFNAVQLNAGVLLSNFDIDAAAASTSTPGFTDADLITATTGGITINCTPTYSDLGEDVDNCPENMKELKHLDSWACTISTTALGTSADLIKLSLGAADINAATKAIVPRADLKQTDFKNLWWVGEKANGGFVAVQILNALATGGLSLTTNKNAKGQTGLEITGHVSLSAQSTVPMIFYSIDPDAVDTTLSALTIGSLTLTPSFDPAITQYSAATTNSTDTITATATDSTHATVTIKNGTTSVTSGSSATWSSGDNTVTITVTNDDESTHYYVNVNKSSE